MAPAEAGLAPAAPRPWVTFPVFVVEDSDHQLVTYTPHGSPMTFPDGPWPTPNGLHPWHGRPRWEGNGCLMIQRPGEHVSVWHFWEGAERTFTYWYLNLQTAFVRSATGFDTQDLELDLIVFPDHTWVVKDEEVLDDRVAEGRWPAELVTWIRAFGEELVGRLETNGPWWDTGWTDWKPPPGWVL